MSSACPSEDLLLRFISGDLDSRRASAVQAHVRDCASCRELVHGTNRVFHTYQTYADDPAEQPKWVGFEAALHDQHETLVRQRSARALTTRRWLSMAATVLIMIAAGAVWYRYTEVPLNAEHVLSQAMAFESQGGRGDQVDRGPRPAASVSFRRVKHAAADVAARRAGTEPERIEVARELTRRLAQYGFYEATALSARHYWNWRTATAAGRRDDQLAWIGDGLIKVSTSTPDGPVREAEITVRSSSYEPIAQTWRFADGFEATMERVTGESAAPIDSTAADADAAAAGAAAANEASAGTSANASTPDFDLVEVEARSALQRLGIAMDDAWVVRRAGARVRISGAVSSPALAEAAMNYATTGSAATSVDLRVRVKEAGSGLSPIANAPGFQSWLEESYEDAQSRARFVPMASDLVERWRVRVNVLAALSKRFPLATTSRLSREAREELDALAAAQYRDVAAAQAAVTAHLAGLMSAPAAAAADTESVSHLPEDWRARVATLESSVSKTSASLATLFDRADLMTADDVRSAANDALRPPLEACARALRD